MYIAFGKPSTDPSGWEKVYANENVTGTVQEEFEVRVDQAGDYSFVIVNAGTNGVTLGLYELIVTQVLDYDLRITSTDAPVYSYTPVNHLMNTASYSLSIENRGLQPMTGIKAYLNANGQAFGISTDGM